jgi:colicin import membrane protein
VIPNITYAGSTSGNPTAVVQVNCAPDGRILSRQITTSSGNAAWDAAVLRAVDATDPMPRDTDGKTPRTFNLRMRPNDAPH